eukprot:6639318-Pyramimonas_sp.AAC.1
MVTRLIVQWYRHAFEILSRNTADVSEVQRVVRLLPAMAAPRKSGRPRLHSVARPQRERLQIFGSDGGKPNALSPSFGS